MAIDDSVVIWKDIKGYEDFYEVNNLGEVRSKIRKGNRPFGVGFYGGVVLKPVKRGNYLNVSLSKHNKAKNFSIHRLVAQAFIDNPHNLPLVNHKDENPTNNCASNLEWCDARYNTTYGTAVERRAKSHSESEKCKHVLQFTLSGAFIREWVSASEAARQLNASAGTIWMCCMGRRKQTKGYKFKFK